MTERADTGSVPAKDVHMAAQITSETDVTYRTHPHGALVATLYRPEAAAIAAVVEVHGGAWTTGERRMNVAIARHLAANGIAVLSLDFRMPPEAAYPETVTDIAAGIRWMRTHSTDVGTVPNRVGLLGTSSGGHLALLAALRPLDERYAGPGLGGEPEIAVGFAVLGWPVSDPLARYRLMRERANTRLLEAHDAFWADETAMAEGSPYDIVARGDAQRLPSLLILQGTNDDNLTPDMQELFVGAYRAKGGSAELALFAGEPHSFIARDPTSAASRDALVRITAFIIREATAGWKDGRPSR
ncbi:MAG TPA: alpha/beta hydrolase [Candidatus Aquilonibacter sp.]